MSRSRKGQPRRRPSSLAHGASDDVTSSAARPEPEFLARRTPRAVAVREADWMPLSAIMAALFFGVAGYIIGEAAFAPFAHPVHWLPAAAGTVLAYAAGLIWHRARGFN